MWLQGGGQLECPGMWPTKLAYCERTNAHCFLAEVGCSTLCHLGLNRLASKTLNLTDHQVHMYDGESRCQQYQYLGYFPLSTDGREIAIWFLNCSCPAELISLNNNEFL